MNDNSTAWHRIKDKPYCDPARRMDFVLLFDVKDGNPNGDPDAGNFPRLDPTTGHGIVTDVCIKRKIRDYLSSALGRPIFIQSKDALNTLLYRTAKDTPGATRYVVEVKVGDDDLRVLLKRGDGSGPSDDQLDEVREWLRSLSAEGLDYIESEQKLCYFGEEKAKTKFKGLLKSDADIPLKADEAIAELLARARNQDSAKPDHGFREAVKNEMCAKYDDIRLFGAVLTGGTNFGQVRGPMQLTFARSSRPILQLDAAITRCAITRDSDRARKETEFGRKPWLSYASYRQHGFYSPALGTLTGITREDLARFWEAIAGMFPHAASASKGEMATQDLVVFVHQNERGNAPSHRLLERVVIRGTNGTGCPSPDLESGAPSLEVKDDANISSQGITIEWPLKDMWPNFPAWREVALAD